jgi:PEP-CTERM motif
MMRLRSLLVLACGLLGLFNLPAAAGIVQYNYVGVPFAVTTGSPPSSVTHISGDFQFNQALVPVPTSALDDISSLITSFSFTDGNQTLTKLNTSSFSFQITLDSSGALVSPWQITIGDLNNGPGLQTFSLTPDQCADNSRGANGYTATIQCFTGVDNAGTWTGPISVPVPEPSSIVLIAGSIGLLGLGWAGAVRRC